MPKMANIVIKKRDGTTDVTYTALVGAAGDGTSAVFRNSTVGTTLAQHPTLKVTSRWNGNKTSRRLTCDFMWPLVKTTPTGPVVAGGMNGSATFLVPQDQAVSLVEEQVWQFANLVSAALIKESAAEGSAPRS